MSASVELTDQHVKTKTSIESKNIIDHQTAMVTMATTGSSQTEEIPEVGGAAVRPLIESFFQKVTADQWRLLKTGAPDDATKIMLAELLLDFITSVSKTLVTALKQNRSINTVISEERVLSSLGDILPQTFAQVLDVKNEEPCVSSERLTNLIVKEVAESVNSALAASVDTLEPVMTPRITPPNRLNVMVGHACNMLKAFMGKVKKLCTPRRKQRSPTTTPPPDGQEHMEDLEVADDHCRSPATSLEAETMEQVSVGSEDSFIIETTKAVQEIISKEVNDIIEPLLDDMTDCEYELLQSDSSREIKIIADDIAQSIVEELNSLEERNGAGASLTSEQRSKLSLRGVGKKIKDFFAKSFAKTQIHRIMAQLRNKFSTNSKADSSQSVQSLDAGVDSLLSEDGEKQGGNEVCSLHKLGNTSSGKVLVFSKVLSDFLYKHLMPEILPEQIVQGGTCKTVTVAPARDTIYGDIQGKVWRFLGLMGWWMNTQAGTHSDRVTLALKDSESVTPTPEVTEESALEQDATTLAERNKMSVKILVEKLVLRILSKAKVNATFGETTMKSLFEKIWAEVEGVDFNITPKTFKNLDKAVFKDLCKNCGSAESVLVSVCLGEPVIEKLIASSFKQYLMTPPKKHSAIYSFFSSLRKNISVFSPVFPSYAIPCVIM